LASPDSPKKKTKLYKHVFIKPDVTSYPKSTRGGGGYPPTEVPHHEDEETAERRGKDIQEMLQEVIVETKSKALKDEMAYFVVDFRIKADHPATELLLSRLQSTLLAFLNKEKSKVLVGSSLEGLIIAAKSASFPESMEKMVWNIRGIRIDEQISKKMREDLEWQQTPKDIDIFVVPNIQIERAQKYISQMREFLEKNEVRVRNFTVDPFSKSGMLSARMDFPHTSKLLLNSSFIYKVVETPRIDVADAQNRRSTAKEENDERNSLANKTAKNNIMNNVTSLPEVCVIDTGVNPIGPLGKLISLKSREPSMPDDHDNNNHGTPVAYLVAYGETNTARARIISHKIISGSVQSNLFGALARAIAMYLHKTRIFTCSITFQDDDEASNFEAWKIDRLVQASNACVIFSAGNVRDTELTHFKSLGWSYPSWIERVAVMPPSNCPAVVSVGSYCRRANPVASIAPSDSPSPFTRYRIRNDSMSGCIKPEIVEHGGNLNNDLHYVGVGVRTFSSLGLPEERIGTSFSAPIVARHLAEVARVYGSKIHNAETLKAIAYSSCIPTHNHPKYVGFGKPDCDETLGSSRQSAKIIFEGEMRLLNPQLKHSVPANRIAVYIPVGVDKIELFLVHSDDYNIANGLNLHTYIEVIPDKPARESPPPPDSGDLNGRGHVKRLVWRYQKAVKGEWSFTLLPHHIGIPFWLRQSVLLRYGGVLKLTSSRPRHTPLVDEVRRKLKDKEYT
jgi:hypothetical protein